jgi:hypothetical protein
MVIYTVVKGVYGWAMVLAPGFFLSVAMYGFTCTYQPGAYGVISYTHGNGEGYLLEPFSLVRFPCFN